MRKQIFKAIADAVAAVPGVAFVDLWNNQVQTLNGGAAFAFAAVFIEFEAVEDVDINVYDASGRSVAIARLVAGDNRTLSLPAGIYIAVASGHSVKVAVR